MSEEFKIKLIELGLNEDQIGKLVDEGVASDSDLSLLTVDQVKQVTGCGLITATKVARLFTPTIIPTISPVAPVSTGPAEVPPPDAEIPENAKPSPAQVNSFATSLGMDSSMLTMMMFAGMNGNTGMGGMDISGMIPVPQIVAGYNPKIRNMFSMVMGTLEERLGVPVVVINGDGGTNHALTVEYIMGLEEGRDPAENNVYFDSNGTPYEVIRVGVDAQSIYDADPLDSARALQKNGMGIGRVNWTGVSLEVKQTAFYAVSRTREIDPTNDSHLSWLRDHVKPTSNRLTFQGQAPKAISEFNEAQRTGSLPTLRVMLTRGPRKKEFMPRRRSGTPRDLAGIGRPENEL